MSPYSELIFIFTMTLSVSVGKNFLLKISVTIWLDAVVNSLGSMPERLETVAETIPSGLANVLFGNRSGFCSIVLFMISAQTSLAWFVWPVLDESLLIG
ncbi:hypothetical protein D3C85_1234830 [compost metagenome]